MEAGCLEWCVVIGLILRDVSVIKQVMGFLDSPEVPPETVQSIRAGLMSVDQWASSDWSVSPQLTGQWSLCDECLIQQVSLSRSVSLSVSLGYKPFLNLIRPQLMKLMEVPVEQVQPEAFQPTGASKLSDPPLLLPRAEDPRCPPASSLPQEGSPGANARPLEDTPEEPEEEDTLEEGSYDCTLS